MRLHRQYFIRAVVRLQSLLLSFFLVTGFWHISLQNSPPLKIFLALSQCVCRYFLEAGRPAKRWFSFFVWVRLLQYLYCMFLSTWDLFSLWLRSRRAQELSLSLQLLLQFNRIAHRHLARSDALMFFTCQASHTFLRKRKLSLLYFLDCLLTQFQHFKHGQSKLGSCLPRNVDRVEYYDLFCQFCKDWDCLWRQSKIRFVPHQLMKDRDLGDLVSQLCADLLWNFFSFWAFNKVCLPSWPDVLYEPYHLSNFNRKSLSF